MVDETTKAWAAGFFDGEGSALIERTGNIDRKSRQIVVAVAGSDSRGTGLIMKNWGGHYRRVQDLDLVYSEPLKTGRKRKIDYTVYFNYDEAKIFLKDIIPYLIVKDKEATVVLRALYAIPALEPGMKRRRRGVSEILEPFYEELQLLRA